MGRFRVLPYRQGSASAKALAEALGGKVLKLVGSKYKYKEGDVVINWGNAACASLIDDMTKHMEYPDNATMYNWMEHTLKGASNKLLFFENMAANAPDIIPKFWKTKEEIPDEEYPVVCRTVLAGHSGDGIVIADVPADAVACKLYVKYEKKKDEYRVHVGQIPNVNCPVPTVIAVQRKARRQDCPNPDWKIRNHANGFVFVRGGPPAPEAVTSSAIRALEASGLDFGAVDVIWNSQKEKAYVLEINTAPGLEGQTIKDYAAFFNPACTENHPANP